MNFPLVVFVTSVALLTLMAGVGDTLRKRIGAPTESVRSDSGLLLSAILTLLFLIIGFSFSMAVNRYDLRKNCEQAEVVAIGTIYSRADLLAPAEGAKVKELLKRYLDQRVLFYTTRSSDRASEVFVETVRIESELWSTILPAVAAVPPPLMGLLVTGMNDVVNSERTSRAAWLNRVPYGAWALMAIIAIGSCGLIGYRARHTDWLAFMIVPVAASVSFFLIADLDSPRAGAIRVSPQNLSNLAESLSAHPQARTGVRSSSGVTP